MFAKLVRDKIIDNMYKIGDTPKFRILNTEEYITQLQKKLSEEASEFIGATKEDVLGELADIQEIIDNLLEAFNFKPNQLKEAQAKKNKKRGSFKQRHYIDHVETNEKSEWIEYFEKNPDKYPEIKE